MVDLAKALITSESEMPNIHRLNRELVSAAAEAQDSPTTTHLKYMGNYCLLRHQASLFENKDPFNGSNACSLR